MFAAARYSAQQRLCAPSVVWRTELLTGAERQPRYCAFPMVLGPPSHCEGGHRALPALHAGYCSVCRLLMRQACRHASRDVKMSVHAR